MVYWQQIVLPAHPVLLGAINQQILFAKFAKIWTLQILVCKTCRHHSSVSFSVRMATLLYILLKALKEIVDNLCLIIEHTGYPVNNYVGAKFNLVV